MSQPDRSARPSQVTVAGWAVAIASVLLLLAVIDTMGKLETVDMRERLSRAVSSGSAKDLGFTVGDATELLRWCLYVSGVAAAASGIFGVFVLQGHRGARIGLSVAAVSIVFTASLAGSWPGFLAMFIGIGTALLWTRPARDWFAGRPVTLGPPVRRPEQPVPPTPEPPAPVAWTPPAPGTAQPPATPGWGMPGPQAWPAPTGWPVPTAMPIAGRPSQVRVACILTWVFSALTALGYSAVLLVLLADKPRFVEELEKSPGWRASFDADTVTTIITVASIVFVIWSLGTLVLATLVWRRVRWAWILLLVSAWTAGLVSVLAFPFSLPYLAAIGASAGMLMRRQTRDWFARAPYPGPQPPQAPRPPVW